jgi:hypothetical protein
MQVVISMAKVGWTWAAPYTIGIDASTHTLTDDIRQQRSMHQICAQAYKEGDNTYGVLQSSIFRFHLGPITDSSVRGGVAMPCWTGGRDAFMDHQDKDVPWIKDHSITREPYSFSLDLSVSLPFATEYPWQFAFSNFLYWHTRREDVILVLRDVEDLFGTTAVYCGRKVVMAPCFGAAVDGKEKELQAAYSKKAYTTLGVLINKSGLDYFRNYPQDALFATLCLLVRNTRTSKVLGQGILFSQTQSEQKRFKSGRDYHDADLATPCRKVH